MSDSATPAHSPDSCRELIVRELAAAGGETVDEVEAQLRGTSGEQKYDSIVIAEALVRVEAVLGIEMPLNDDTAKALRSVDALAKAVSEYLEENR